MKSVPYLILGCFGALGAACGGTTPDTTSTVQGALVVSAFPAGTSRVEASDELGALQSVSVGADGTFALSLAKNHRYTLSAVHGSGRVPFVFPRVDGRLDRTFEVLTGAAVVDLGKVRHLDKAPTAGFVLKSAVPDAAEGDDGECVDGFQAGTSTPCVDDDDKTACEGADGGDGDGECVNGVDQNGAACTDDDVADNGDGDGECENGVDQNGAACTDDEGDGDGECENGVDQNGAACTDDDEAAADPAAPMAIPEHNPPDQISGCDEGGEEQDD